MSRLRKLTYVTCLLACLAAFAPTRVSATVYRVGPEQPLTKPSQAARIVRSGDTVQIEPTPGGYYDCAIWRADDLTIEGIGTDVRLTDMTCQGKAIFVTVGNRITIRNLTFARARVPDRNGAGIRAEGEGLVVENSRFVDNESGILTTTSPNSEVTINDSEFTANGTCALARCADAIAVGNIAVLTVTNSRIFATRGGIAIRSMARYTRLTANEIGDGQTGTGTYLVDLPNGGSLEMKNNALERGPRSAEPNIVVRVLEGADSQKVKTLAFSGNALRNDTTAPLTFVLNWTGTDARMSDNILPRDVTPVRYSGYSWFLAKSFVHQAVAKVWKFASAIYHHIGQAARATWLQTRLQHGSLPRRAMVAPS